MMSKNKQVCCCGASTWATFFASFQIVVTILGIVGVSAVIIKENQGEGSQYDFINKRDRQRRGVLIGVLVCVIVNFVFGILLLIGNKREKVGLLRAWMTVTCISVVVGLLAVIVGLTQNTVISLVTTSNLISLVPVIIYAVISGFMIYVVYQRIEDIKIGSGGMSNEQRPDMHDDAFTAEHHNKVKHQCRVIRTQA